MNDEYGVVADFESSLEKLDDEYDIDDYDDKEEDMWWEPDKGWCK